jgi:transcriptional regulator with XRE-family HTH domain
MTEAAMFASPLRAYVVTLRKGRGITQEDIARRIGMKVRTYVAWERGTTQSIKEHFARALITALDGSQEHRDLLDTMSIEEAQNLAREWLSLSEEQRRNAQEAAHKFARVIELSDSDPAGLEDVIEKIRQDAQADPQFLTWLSGYLEGRGVRSRRE